MDEHIFDRIHEVDLKKTMENSYIDYAMSVIAARALPDVRDGLKPVQRRILFSMQELHNDPDKPHRKCARIVGDTMGKYHPHGDSSIYEALVKLAQDFNTRYMLVDGHGNFGSVDGDGAAAMRYTEARLSKISMHMLADLEKDTVDFIPNFDETEKEPTVLPARFPNLLVNGTSGIAVGMATNIPPHNLREVTDAVIKIIDNQINEDRETDIDEIMEIIKGPDFPTGATILGRRGIEEAYRTGKGKIRVRAVAEINSLPSGKSEIIISEIPYMVNKSLVVQKIAELAKTKKVDGITSVTDQSNMESMRIVVEVRKDANANIVLNKLYKHTQLQDTFGVNMLALVKNEPKVLNILEMLTYYLEHQEEVITRRSKFELDKAEKRAHIVEGLLIALDNIDEVIKIVRGANTVQDARDELCRRFGLSEAQAKEIVEMRIRQLTGMERGKLEDEYKDLQAKITELKEILGDRKKLLTVIKTEMSQIADKYADDRRTAIGYDEEEISMEDIIPDDPTVITMTSLGYIKRMTPDNFRSQNRGGRGIKGMQTIENDYIEDIMMTTNHHMLLFFTTKGRVYKLKAYEIPECSRTARGMAIVNLLQLMPDEKISSIVPVDGIREEEYLFMVTKKGFVKRTSSLLYANIRKTGIQAITLRDDDELIEVKPTDTTKDIIMVTKFGQCIRFKETDVRPTGRSAMGVIGMNLNDEDEIVGMQLDTQGDALLIVSENGLGKRTDISEFTTQYRGGKGVKCYKINDRSGNVIGVKAVDDTREIMLITDEGIIIRMQVADISKLGRITTGVKLMNLDENVKVAKVAKVRVGSEWKPEEESEENEASEDAEPTEE